MAKIMSCILSDYECFYAPDRFCYIKEIEYADIIFFKSEKKYPGEMFFKFGPITSTIIQHMWINEDEKYDYVFIVTLNHLYGFRRLKNDRNIS